jgi:hypothetical protein
MRNALIVLLLAAGSLTVSNCSKTYPTTYIYDTVQVQGSQIRVVVKTTSGGWDIYANNQFIINTYEAPSDTISVPDSSHLYATTGTNHRDTIATRGLVWTIQ